MKHTVMPHSLAKALIEAGMKHFDDGGIAPAVGTPSSLPSSPSTPPGPTPTGSPDALGAFGPMFGQSSYSAQLAPVQQSNYAPLIGTATQNAVAGYGTSQQIQQQQQALSNSLLAQSQGQGPNPAQAQLAQSTGQNAQMQAALMASQRGSGANAGLMARQSAQTGAAAQQTAAGQAAILQAQQELAAQGQLQQQQQSMAGENISEQGVNAGLLNAGATAQTGQNNTNVQNYNDVQAINSGVANTNMQTEGQIQGGMLQGGGSMMSMFYKGGKVPSHLQKMAAIYHPAAGAGPQSFKSGGKVPGKAAVRGNSPKNDTVPALLSPEEEVLPRSVTQAPNAPQKAYEFVKHLQDQQGKKPPKGYDKIASSKMNLKTRVQKLEKLCYGGAA